DLRGAHRPVDGPPPPGPARGGRGAAGRLPGHRDQGRGAAAAAAAVPAEDPRRVERGQLPAGGQLLQLLLHRHPVHAAGARVLRAEDRGRLARGVGHRPRAGRAGPDPRHPHLGQAGHGGRDGPGRRRDLVGGPGPGSPANLAGRRFLAGGSTFAFIPVSIGALAGVTEHDAGVASGLLNTPQQIGGAIGVAVASPVAATHSRLLLSQGHAAAAALTGGFQQAFWGTGVTALAALPVTFLLIRRTESAPPGPAPPQPEAPPPAPPPRPPRPGRLTPARRPPTSAQRPLTDKEAPR